MQVIAQSTNERMFAACTRQESPIGRQRIQGAKESKALNEFTRGSIDGDHAFCFELAEWDMNRPLVRPGGAKAIAGQIDTLTDAHTGVADQQKGIAAEIVTAKELLL
jgi:hypothetical protein